MKNTLPIAPAATAETLAAQFQVTALEPRVETAWSGGRDDTSIEHATPNGR